MAGRRQQSRIQSGKIAFCGMLVALSVVLMLSGGLIPIATYCAPMFCALLLLPILIEFGKKAAWTAFISVALITLFLGIDKEAAFFYLFIGHYPLLKWEIERIKQKRIKLLVKLLVFNLSICVRYWILGSLLGMDAIVAEFSEMGSILLIVFVVMLNLCLFLYDRLIFPLMLLYDRRIRPKLRYLRR